MKTVQIKAPKGRLPLPESLKNLKPDSSRAVELSRRERDALRTHGRRNGWEVRTKSADTPERFYFWRLK
jgi:hypothetical protein